MSFKSISLLSLLLLPSLIRAEGLAKKLPPFFEKYCVSCHGPDEQQAKMRVDVLDPDLVNGNDGDTWQEVLDRINLSEMPPDDAASQPTVGERQAVVDALTSAMRTAVEAKRSTGGRNVLRRLTAYEYNNTLRDLLGLDLDYAVDLPPEGVAREGFKNNSSVLGTSALHLEYFERIARSALERILRTADERPTPYFVRVEPELAFAKKEESENGRNRKRADKKAVDRAQLLNHRRRVLPPREECEERLVQARSRRAGRRRDYSRR